MAGCVEAPGNPAADSPGAPVRSSSVVGTGVDVPGLEGGGAPLPDCGAAQPTRRTTATAAEAAKPRRRPVTVMFTGW